MNLIYGASLLAVSPNNHWSPEKEGHVVFLLQNIQISHLGSMMSVLMFHTSGDLRSSKMKNTCGSEIFQVLVQ